MPCLRVGYRRATYVLVGQADVAYVGIARLDHLLGPRGLPPSVKKEED